MMQLIFYRKERRDRAAPNNLPRTSHSRLPPYLHDCNASLLLLGDTEHCCVNSPISLASHASFNLPSPPPPPPPPPPPLLPVLLRLYECCNTKAIVGSHQWGGACGAGWSTPLPALHLAFLAPTLFWWVLPPFFTCFFSIAKYLALLHNPPCDFSPVNPSTRPFLFHLPYFSRTLSSGLSPARSSSL